MVRSMIFQLLFMGLKPLCWLVIAYAIFVPLVLLLSLTCWMGPRGVILHFVWCSFGFVYSVVEMVSEGSPGHGPIHLLTASAAEIGFRWDPVKRVGHDLGCLCARLLFLMLGGIRLLPIFVMEEALGVGHCWMSLAPCSFLIRVMFERETRLC